MELVLLEERSSKGVVKDYFTTLDTGQGYNPPPYAYSVLMDMVENDPILFSAVSLTADLMTYRGYDFRGKNIREIERARKLFNEYYDYDQVIDNIIWQLLVYGDAYLELRWNESKTEIIELHPLDTSQMVIKYNEFGDIKYYLQKINDKGEQYWPRFELDEVIYFRQYWVGTQVYSRAPFKAIAKSFSTKVVANDYLMGIFKNLPPKMIYFLKSASKEQRKDFIQNVIKAKTNPQLDIFASGEAFDSKVLQFNFDQGLINFLEYLRKEVLMTTRVPPHWIGILDGANRGIGENVVIPFETKIKKMQQKIASAINKELLPKLKLTNVEYYWNAISLMDEKTILEMSNFLKAQGFDSETIIEFVRSHGIVLRDGAEIEVQSTGSGQVLQNETAQSRHRQNEKTDKMTNNLDKRGVSEEGKQKLEQNKGD